MTQAVTLMRQNSQIELAISDLVTSFRMWRIWVTLAWSELRQRYARSVLGPFWTSLQTGALILCLGLLYGRLMRMNIEEFMPFVAVGLTMWQFIATSAQESCSTFIVAENFIKAENLPKAIFVYKLVLRNFLYFLHNFIVALIVIIIFPPQTLTFLPLALLGLAVVVFAVTGVALTLSVICTRYRDLQQALVSIIQLLFFASPIVWHDGMLGEFGRSVMLLNPVTHFLAVVRDPLLGMAPSAANWLGCAIFSAIFWSCALLVFWKGRSRIAYWL